ncbi:MAG: tRNA lysidine(34) synthetase TilS [Chlamydiales bacterium]|nr:tRNA lysidine(34) synthetase TilS [Chlamydiales bacterium]
MIEAFLHSQKLEGVPLLLALSGGPDSTALFHLLLDSGHPFQTAHVDHGWRTESAVEAAEIARMCAKNGVKCHIRALNLQGKNLEERSRVARLGFFREICAAEGLNRVVLGHHADDQAETVLKRIFEGASLPKLKGLAPKTQIGALVLYRPLLNTRKKEILDWLDVRGIPYFLDPTNRNTRYLRSRMRETLLPTLSKQFGKQIETSLCRLGESAAELAEFLETILEPLRNHIVVNEGDTSLDFNRIPPQAPFIYKVLLRDFFEKERLALSKPVLETIFFHIQNRGKRKTIQVGQRKVEMDRGNLTIRKLKLLSL